MVPINSSSGRTRIWHGSATAPACNGGGIADVFGSEHGVEALEQKEASLQ
jgi:hypothetical protein